MGRRVMTKWLSSVAVGIVKAGGFVSSYVCLSLMIALMALDPVMRYIVGNPFFWSNEITTYLMMLVVFNGFGITLIKNKHIRVTLIFDRLSPKIQNMVWVVITFVGLFYIAFLTYALIQLAQSSLEYGVRSATTEMVVYPWQMIAIWGMIAFFVAMLLLVVNRIAIASGHGEEKTAIDDFIGH